MVDTMFGMDYIHVDNLLVDQLLEDDLIEIENEVVKVLNLVSLKDGYAITFENEFGEKETIELNDNAVVKLFILQ